MKKILLIFFLVLLFFVSLLFFEKICPDEYINNRIKLTGFDVRLFSIASKNDKCLILTKNRGQDLHVVEIRPKVSFLSDSSRVMNMGSFQMGMDGPIDSSIGFSIKGKKRGSSLFNDLTGEVFESNEEFFYKIDSTTEASGSSLVGGCGFIPIKSLKNFILLYNMGEIMGEFDSQREILLFIKSVEEYEEIQVSVDLKKKILPY